MRHTETDRNDVEVLAADFAERLRSGQEPSMKRYIDQHPQLADDIRQIFPAVEALERLRVRKLSGGTGRATLGMPRPNRLGDLRIIRELGRGGMGVVYEAEQESLGRRVAVKVLPPHTLTGEKHLHRFEREARTAARLHHTNIVPILGVGHHQGYHYYVMQYIDGIGLDEMIDQLRASRKNGNDPRIETAWQRVHGGVDTVAFASGERETNGRGSNHRMMKPAVSPPDRSANTVGVFNHPSEVESASAHQPAATDRPTGGSTPTSFSANHWANVARIGRQIAEALQYAHQHNTLHRDIKPSNLIIDAEGTAWVADFGLAKVVSQDAVTQTGDIIGTLRYMAPEQLDGQADPRSDIYGLGLTLYELLTLEPAHDDTSRKQALLANGCRSTVIAPRKRIATIPRDLETIVLKAVAEQPDHRYQTAGALAVDLECFLDNRPIAARRTSMLERLWRWSRRNRAVAALSAVAILLLALVAITASVGYVRTDLALRRESAERTRAEATLGVSLEALDNIFRRFLPPSSLEPLHEVLEEDAEPGLAPPAQPVPSPATAALLSDMLAFYDRLAMLNSESLSLRQEAARATRRVGTIHERLGQYTEARSAFDEAIKRYEVLAGDATDRGEHELEIARIHNELGSIERRSGGFREAGSSHESALVILNAMSQQTQSAEFRYELARTHYFLGAGARWRRGPRSQGGGRQPGEGQPPRMQPGPVGRGSPETRQPPSPADETEGHPNGALRGHRGDHTLNRHIQIQHLNAAIELLDALSGEEPDIFEYRRLLALCYRERSGGDFSTDADTSLAILQELVSQFPDLQDLRYDLIQTYAMVNTRHLPADERGRVEQRLRDALALAVELDDNVPAYLLLRARVHSRLAGLLRLDAEGTISEGTSSTSRVDLPIDTSLNTAGKELAGADDPAAVDLDAKRLARLHDAADHYRQALGLNARLPEQMLTNPFFQARRARMKASLASLLLVTGQPNDCAAAIELFGQAKNELEQIVAERPDARLFRPMIDDLQTQLSDLVEQEN